MWSAFAAALTGLNLLLFLIAIGVAVATWKQHPAVSRLATIGWALLLLCTGLDGVVGALQPLVLSRGYVDMELFATVSNANNICGSLIATAAICLIGAAAFRGRHSWYEAELDEPIG